MLRGVGSENRFTGLTEDKELLSKFLALTTLISRMGS
jgi:hypothetical protein